MALTKEQETTIAKFMATASKTNQFYSYADIHSALGETCTDISSQVLGKVIRNISVEKNYKIIVKKGHPTALAIQKMSEIVKVIKDKSVVSFLDDNNNIVVSFDYRDNNSTPFRSLLSFSKNLKFISIFLSNITRYTQIPEYVWSYIDLFQDLYERGLFEKCSARYILTSLNALPKGYIKFIQEYNFPISDESFSAFTLLNKHYPIQSIKRIMNNQNHNLISFSTLLYFTYNDYLKIQKIIINSIKDNYYFDKNDINKLCYKIRQNGVEILDINRDIKKNIKIYTDYENTIKNKKISQELHKLNFLNGFTIDDYIVVVPQNLEDLQLEGKQQHNCVGSFYNDSIIEGENLIYFLRKKENPNKSVVTCRYNIKREKTVEYRTKNNQSTTLEQEHIIAEIDKIINKNLA